MPKEVFPFRSSYGASPFSIQLEDSFAPFVFRRQLHDPQRYIIPFRANIRGIRDSVAAIARLGRAIRPTRILTR
jgi:hypothetical protein